MRYPYSDIEIRVYGKGELAKALKVSYTTFYRRLKKMEPELKKEAEYNTYSKVLTPLQVRLFLEGIGYL